MASFDAEWHKWPKLKVIQYEAEEIWTPVKVPLQLFLSILFVTPCLTHCQHGHNDQLNRS